MQFHDLTAEEQPEAASLAFQRWSGPEARKLLEQFFPVLFGETITFVPDPHVQPGVVSGYDDFRGRTLAAVFCRIREIIRQGRYGAIQGLLILRCSRGDSTASDMFRDEKSCIVWSTAGSMASERKSMIVLWASISPRSTRDRSR